MSSPFSFFSSDSTTTYSPLLIGLLTSLAAIAVTRLIFPGRKLKIIKSPETTLLPKLSAAEIKALPYPPDALPGGRSVESPYGTVRVYEWGPEDGRKVLLVHGITTPCLALGAVAHELVERGCRVMLFDEWGRGYSDAPADLPYDERLYSTQILIAVTSSPLSWIGGPDGGFSVIGYSLGGGISLCFTSYFGHLVKSLVLMAPTGLIRPRAYGMQRLLPYLFDFVPEPLLDAYLRKRLQSPMFPKENKEDVTSAEVAINEPKLQVTPASQEYPNVTVLEAMKWNIAHHAGSIRSFASVAKHGPTSGQQAAWKRLALQKRKILIIVASEDSIILPQELKPDVEEIVLGTGTEIVWRTVEAAHDYATTDPGTIVGHICSFWEM